MKKYEPLDNKTVTELEAGVLAFWKNQKVFDQSVANRSPENAYVFYDGPPFISGLPHYGHLLGSIAKDIIPRYWTMKGKRVERVWGWDAHGLTVENKVQKQLDIKTRRDIEKYGLEKFIQACYTYTSETSEEWKWYIDKIARWVDMDHAYKTTDQKYMESVIWAFKELYTKGLIYEGVYTSLFCTTCGTPVSSFEIAMDNTYKDFEDPAITVKFPISTEGEFKGVNILAWTTTPWTIPSNRALVIDPKETYILVEQSGQKFVVAQKRLASVFADTKHTVLKEFLGEKLIGLHYDPPYTFYKFVPGEFEVYEYEGMVNMEDGTGVVHSAPGFGEIDTLMGKHYHLTVMTTVDDEGKLMPGTAGDNPFAGQFYVKANQLITQDLESKGLLFQSGKIVHRVPYHDRCDTVLIQRAQNSWFVNVNQLKSLMISTNENINWVPDHLKDGRFKIGINQAPDWCISRSRFWATPMPVWQASDGEKIVIGSVKELEDLSGKKVTDLHRPYIDEITITKDGKLFKRIPEVLDSWFEAGSMPYAQLHYPMENSAKFEHNYPGDFIVEYIAQTRAWFFFMHVLSNALFGTSSFKNVISTGVMAGSDGRKMSKTYGNYTDPKSVLENIGGDALRLYLMSSPLMIGENANFDDDELKNKLRNVLNPLWNSVKYFSIYASQYSWQPPTSFEPTNLMDKWIITRTNATISTFSDGLEKYLIPQAVLPFETLVDDLSRWYVRRSRDRISQGDPDALATLYTVLSLIAKGFAPIIPFLSENIYQYLKIDDTEPLSVHLCDYPVVSSIMTDEENELCENMELLRALVSLGHSARTESKIAVRQPLQKVLINIESELPKEYLELLQEELNVKEVVIEDSIEPREGLVVQETKDIKIALDIQISAELELEGQMRDFMRKVQDLRKEHKLSVGELVDLTYPKTQISEEMLAKFGEDIKKKTSTRMLIAGELFGITKL